MQSHAIPSVQQALLFEPQVGVTQWATGPSCAFAWAAQPPAPVVPVLVGLPDAVVVVVLVEPAPPEASCPKKSCVQPTWPNAHAKATESQARRDVKQASMNEQRSAGSAPRLEGAAVRSDETPRATRSAWLS